MKQLYKALKTHQKILFTSVCEYRKKYNFFLRKYGWMLFGGAAVQNAMTLMHDFFRGGQDLFEKGHLPQEKT